MLTGGGPRLSRGQAQPSLLTIGAGALSNRELWERYLALPGLNLPGLAEEWNNLGLESDAGLFFEGLLSCADRLRDSNQIQSAAELYAAIAAKKSEALDPNVSVTAERAQARLDALVGKGTFGARFEVLAQRLAKDASDYRMIVPMIAGSVVFQTVRAATLGRLLSSAAPAWYRRGVGARFAAGLIGFAAEVPVFSLSNRTLQDLSGAGVSWDTESVARDLLGAGLTLGALKGSGYLGHRAVQGIAERAAFGRFHSFQKFSQAAIPQLSIFTGMMAAHQVEAAIGLRPHVDGATAVTDTLASMLSLSVGGRIGHRLLGQKFSRFQQDLNLRTLQISSLPPTAGPQRPLAWQASSGVAGLSRPWSEAPPLPPVYLSSTMDPEGKAETGDLAPPERVPAQELNRFSQKTNDAEGDTPVTPIPLRDYQEKMLQALERDVRANVSPWLGLAAPMQTGKSYLIGPLVEMLRRHLGPRARVVILSSARIITQQIQADLTGSLSEPIGRFDGLKKDIRPITVASVYSLSRNLEEFPLGDPVILINDEAYSTQSETFRRVYSYFGLGEVESIDGRAMLRPKAGNGRIIGFSGTGGGLEGYHVSHQINLLEAIETGIIRNMRGERVMLSISSEEKVRGIGKESMIWWKATAENAAALAQLYDQKILGKFKKNLIYVPTIQHGQLMLKVLEERFGETQSRFVHSEMSDSEFQEGIEHWQKNGGALISIRRLGRGFRAMGAQSVFHTYQTTSPELFAQRTGRAWAKTDIPLADLHVLEVVWNKRGSFANLARLLGLIDYPGATPFSSRNLPKLLEGQKKSQEANEQIRSAIEAGRASPIFVGIPLQENWRRQFMDLVNQNGGIPALSEKTGLDTEILAGFALGALPVRLNQIQKLENYFGGPEQARLKWIQFWDNAVEDVLEGRLRLDEGFESDLMKWREQWSPFEGTDRTVEAASHLDKILDLHLGFLAKDYFRPSRTPFPVTEQDREILREAHDHYWSLLPDDARDPGGPSLVKGLNQGKWRDLLESKTLTDAEWRRSWLALANRFELASQNTMAGPGYRGMPRGSLAALIRHFFRRQGWNSEPNSAQEKLMYFARRAVALKFGSSLPTRPGIKGVGNHDFSTIHRWLRGEKMVFKGVFTPTVFYQGVKNLLRGLGMSPPFIRSLLAPAIFQENNWSFKAKTASEELLKETRYWLAVRLGGHLPREFFETDASMEPSLMGELEFEHGTLRDLNSWIQTGLFEGFKDIPIPIIFYPMLTRLLLAIKAPPSIFISTVIASLKEEWDPISLGPGRNFRSYSKILSWLQDREVSTPDIEAISDTPENPVFDAIIGQELSEQIGRALKTLPPFEEKVIRGTFGFEEDGRTQLEMGEEIGLSSGAISKYKIQALKKLRHPSRFKRLIIFFRPMD